MDLVENAEQPEDELEHIGIKRRSGRYPWGSGDDPYQNALTFQAQIKLLRDKGMTNAAIAKAFGMSTSDVVADIAIAKNVKRAADEALASRLRNEKQMSPTAIGKQMGISESSVRSLLDPSIKARNDVVTNTADFLESRLKAGAFLDIGKGAELDLGISKEKLAVATEILRQKGVANTAEMYAPQVGRVKQNTTMTVLIPGDISYEEAFANRHKIEPIKGYTDDGGQTFKLIEKPQSVSSKRLEVRYGPDGGSDMDGVVELRRGVKDLSLGGKRYAQVRIAVDDTHFIKGMAIHADDLPPGIDLRFNTNKKSTGNKLDALKPISDDPENAFGSVVRQKKYVDDNGVERLSAINLVGSKEGSYEEGGWDLWKRQLSSQFLSKQPPQVAKEQLDLAFKSRKADLDEIASYTNPAVKKKLLASFADSCDSSARDLEAAALPRQANRVLLPSRHVKPNEVYAPSFDDGEKVVLVRHPHGGTFELPELTVNNSKYGRPRKIYGNILDAVVVHPSTAKQLSGADFDGDTVVVIPNRLGKIKTSRPLEALKDFDPHTQYAKYDGMKVISDKHMQRQMGEVSNLITDMTIKGAHPSEIALAVKHSMVVIDSAKHKLNWKQSAIDNRIASLKDKYQNNGGSGRGASTIVSRASSEARVPDRRPRKRTEGGPIDPITGEKVFTPTGKRKIVAVRDKAGNLVRDENGKVLTKDMGLLTERSTKMAETRDAHKLVSSDRTDIEVIYANHANRVKALANQARLELLAAPKSKYNPSARKAYPNEVASLISQLNQAKKNQVLERHSQHLANLELGAKRRANPDFTKKQIKTAETQAITKARARMKRGVSRINISPKEWEAIQAGAISDYRLNEILRYADDKQLRQYAMPKSRKGIPPGKLAMARNMAAKGYIQSEIAAQLGVSTSALNKALNQGEE